MEFHLMDVSMDQPQQHWLGEQEVQGFYVEFSHFLSMSQGNLSMGIDKKNIRRLGIVKKTVCYYIFSVNKMVQNGLVCGSCHIQSVLIGAGY